MGNRIISFLTLMKTSQVLDSFASLERAVHPRHLFMFAYRLIILFAIIET